jgi:putative chitinase
MSFNFDFRVEHTREILKGNRAVDEWHQALVDILPKWRITTVNRVAAFLAQCSHESVNFTVLEENLNYSWQGLRKIFPRYFPTDSLAKQYHRQPEKIANRVYDDANRSSKLGNTAPGDGWKFRGRGIIQLTGKNNYQAFATSVDMTLDQVIEYVQTKDGAMESAAWFWNLRNINSPADAGDIDRVSRLVNGGTIGLQHRRELYHKAVIILGNATTRTASEASTTSTPTTNNRTLRVGSKGPDVIVLQRALGIKADGVFGSGTADAVRKYQLAKGLVADGIVGPTTFKALGI